MERTVNAVVDSFFEKWTNETLAWYEARIREAEEMGSYEWEKANHNVFSKADIELIRYHPLHERKGWATSIETIVRRDMETKKAKLYTKVFAKVGDITEVDLHCGQDGTPNGWVKGTKGSVTIQTIVAGGYNIQCLHYRVLVK
jgi:hypothetical protein